MNIFGLFQDNDDRMKQSKDYELIFCHTII